MFDLPIIRDREFSKISERSALLFRYIAAEQNEIKNHGHDSSHDITRRFTRPIQRPLKRIQNQENEQKQNGSDGRRKRKKKGKDNDNSKTDNDNDNVNNNVNNGDDDDNNYDPDKLDLDNTFYSGLYSNEVYSASGKILHNTVRKRQLASINNYIEDDEEGDERDDAVGDREAEQAVQQKIHEEPSSIKPLSSVDQVRGGMLNTNRQIDLVSNGLDILPKSVETLVLIKDSPATVAVCSNTNISEKTRRILTKNNLAFPKYEDSSLKPRKDLYEEWHMYGKQIRHSNIVNSLMRLAILRRDYALASRAFSILLRFSGIDIRLVWTVALELLIWRRELRDSESFSKKTTDEEEEEEENFNVRQLPTNNGVHTIPSMDLKTDEEFLQWMILNYPASANNRPSRGRAEVNALDVYPHFLLSRLRHSDPKGALDRLEDLILVPPYSEDPVYYALCGIATIQLMMMQKNSGNKNYDDAQRRVEQLATKTQKYFEQCLKYGGVIPEDFLNFEISNLIGTNNESDEEEKEEEEGLGKIEGGDEEKEIDSEYDEIGERYNGTDVEEVDEEMEDKEEDIASTIASRTTSSRRTTRRYSYQESPSD